MAESRNVSRRGFLKVTAVTGCAAMTMGVLGGCTEPEQGLNQVSEQPEETSSTEQGIAEGAKPIIYLIDRMVTKPGKGREIYDRYLEHFNATASEKGMKLEHAIVAPPLWLIDDASSNTLEFIWSFEGYGKFAAGIAYGNAEVTKWWRDIEESLENRDRSYFSTETDLEVLGQ